jgi:heptosyltransferase I
MTGLDGVRRIRIVLLTGLGDVVHGLPVVCAIRRERPDIRVTWVAEPMPAGVLSGHPAIERVVVFHKKDGLAGVWRLRNDLKGDRPDLSLNFNIYFKSLFPVLLGAAPRRLGFDRRRARDGVWLSSNERLDARPRAHTQDMFLEFAARLGVPADPIEWRLEPGAEERVEQAAFYSRIERPAAAIVPASANSKKDWIPARWVEVADRLWDRGLQPVLVGGPSDRERGMAREIVEHSSVPVIDALGDGVRRLVWLLDGCRLVIAPDTGPVHIARALGVPVIGLYGHTNPWRVGPWHAFQELWIDAYTDDGEAPDPSRFDPKHGRMERITTEDVMTKVDLALERYSRSSASTGDVARKPPASRDDGAASGSRTPERSS